MSCLECVDICTHYNLFNEVEYSNNMNNPEEATPQNCFTKNDWIIVIYDSIWYPGEIVEVHENILTTKFMARKKKNVYMASDRRYSASFYNTSNV